MMDIFFEIFNHNFMIYALIIGLSLGLAASLLSPFLVLNHQSMIADGLSHVSFTGIIIGLLVFPNEPIYIALPIAILASILITYLSNQRNIEQDAAIGVTSAFSLALGLIAVSLARGGFNTDIESLLTGSILSVSITDVILSICLLITIVIFVLYLYRPLVSYSFDPLYAKFSKVKTKYLKYALSVLTSVFIVLGVRTVGMLLISSFIIFPALIASQISKSFSKTMFLSGLFAFNIILIAILGTFMLSLSGMIDLPTGSSIVVTYTVFLFSVMIIKRLKRRH